MSLRRPTRPVWAELSRAALAGNYRALVAQAAPAELVAIIKANAYGHGAAEAQRTLLDAGCRWFAVTSIEEACALPPLPPHARMLVLSGIYPGEAAETVAHNVTPVLSSVEQVQSLAAAVDSALPQRAGFRVHLEVDTGMARQGLRWDDDAALTTFADSIAARPALALEGVMTHFASAEDTASSQTSEQVQRFAAALQVLRDRGCRPALIHAGNSASIFDSQQGAALAQLAQASGSRLLARPGIALYGYGAEASARRLQPVLSWKTRITALRTLSPGEGVSYNATFRAARTTHIALLPVGYADGYNRLLSNRGEVLVRGQRAPVAGRVTMDQIMVDVTDIPGVAAEDEAVLIGTQGQQSITAEQIAQQIGTISYEVLCAIGPRVTRLWHD